VPPVDALVIRAGAATQIEDGPPIAGGTALTEMERMAAQLPIV
jgi:hypothetical protein